MVIVVDFDGTLALGDTANLPSMSPNLSLKKLLTELSADDNYIKIVTARGSKSCENFDERKLKYEKTIKAWLNEHNIPYNEVSFFKEYGDIYIDDKSHNIKDGLFYEKLDSPFTQNSVRRLNEWVIKNSSTTQDEAEWYRIAERLGIKTASVLSYDRDTLTTAYIEGKKFNNPHLSYTVLSQFKTLKPTHSTSFAKYIDRIDSHLSKNENIFEADTLLSSLNNISPPATFNHGDFSIDNMIEQKGSLYLFDPIFGEDIFQSYQLDAAKHLLSLLYYSLDYPLYKACRDMYVNNLNVEDNVLDILMASESVRVSAHRKAFSSISNNLISSILH